MNHRKEVFHRASLIAKVLLELARAMVQRMAQTSSQDSDACAEIYRYFVGRA